MYGVRADGRVRARRDKMIDTVFMKSYILSLLEEEHIHICGAVPLSACRVTRRYLLERVGIADGTVLCFATPYYVEAAAPVNISRYAWGRDYHVYVKQLSERLLPCLRQRYPHNRFALFADHSPIDERHAAAISGIGILGNNGLVITDDYSSYVFIAELVTDADIGDAPHEVRHCEGCGLCRTACPYHFEGCLSELTQRRGELSEADRRAVLAGGSAWGCDICGEVCPHTRAALRRGSIHSPIPFFAEAQLPFLTSERLAAMSDEQFALRAYSWRGRDVIMRNLKILEDTDEARAARDT